MQRFHQLFGSLKDFLENWKPFNSFTFNRQIIDFCKLKTSQQLHNQSSNYSGLKHFENFLKFLKNILNISWKFLLNQTIVKFIALKSPKLLQRSFHDCNKSIKIQNFILPQTRFRWLLQVVFSISEYSYYV